MTATHEVTWPPAWQLTTGTLGPRLMRIGVVYESRPGRVAQRERLPIFVDKRATAPLEILPYAWWAR